MTAATGFSAIVGQPFAISVLKTLLRNGKLPHALLFTGDDGVGKKMTATAFAMACNCLTLKAVLDHRPHLDVVDACGECAPCRKITGNNHADVIHIAPQSSMIRIDRIRSLLETLSLKPNEAQQRVVIISDAHAMNPEAGNALLKVLEEPPARTLLVLTTRQPSDLLPTVVSRCRQIRFMPLAAADVKRLLKETDSGDTDSVEIAAALCDGSYSRARRLLDKRWLGRREWIIKVLTRRMAGDESDIRAWLAFAEMLSRKKDLIEESLEIITIWLRDVLVAGYDPTRILNRDHRKALTKTAGRIDRRRLLEQMDAVDGATTALRSNANVRLTLDAMVLRMAGTLK
jgi:DNA polymerase III subunit delta'